MLALKILTDFNLLVSAQIAKIFGKIRQGHLDPKNDKMAG